MADKREGKEGVASKEHAFKYHGIGKKIYALTDQKTYSNFIKRAKAEGFEIDEAFSKLVKDYAQGNVDLIRSSFKQKKEHHPGTGANYLGGKR